MSDYSPKPITPPGNDQDNPGLIFNNKIQKLRERIIKIENLFLNITDVVTSCVVFCFAFVLLTGLKKHLLESSLNMSGARFMLLYKFQLVSSLRSYEYLPSRFSITKNTKRNTFIKNNHRHPRQPHVGLVSFSS